MFHGPIPNTRHMIRNASRALATAALMLPFLAGCGTTSAGSELAELPPVMRPIEAGVEAPFLWRVENGENDSYLFGTIHLPDDRVLALAPAVQAAFDDADVVYTEIPMSPMAQAMMLPKMMQPAGETLAKQLPPELYERVEAHFADHGIALSAMDRMKVWVVMAQAGTLEYLQEMMSKPVLDQMLWNKAQEAGKQRGALETIESQVAVFESLTLEEQIRMFGQAMDAIEKAKAEGRQPAQTLLEAYLSGDSGRLLGEMTREYDPDDEVAARFLEELLTKRDVKMTDKIAELLAENPGKSYFFAVGSLHLPRENGIVPLLEEKGFEVERVTGE
jgi:uncharacterized protein YbaP (TraB family)